MEYNYDIFENLNKKLLLTSQNIMHLYGNELFDFYLHQELDEDNYICGETFLVSSKKSELGIVFYAPDLDNICFFVHEGVNTFYEIEYEKIEYIKSKSWYSELLNIDVSSLFNEIKNYKLELKEIADNY